MSPKNGKSGGAAKKRTPKPATTPTDTTSLTADGLTTEVLSDELVGEHAAADALASATDPRSERPGDTRTGWDATPRRWLSDGAAAARQVEAHLPDTVPVALGAGVLALVGVVEWPVALGGAGLYGMYRLLRPTGGAS